MNSCLVILEKRMEVSVLWQEQRDKVRVAFEFDAKEIVGFTFVPVGTSYNFV